MKTITRRSPVLLLAMATLLAFSATNCGIFKQLRKAGIKDKATESFIKSSGKFVYALLDSPGDSKKFMKKYDKKPFSKLSKKKVKKISTGLKTLNEIKKPAKAKKKAMSLLKKAKKMTDNPKPEMAAYLDQLKGTYDKLDRLISNWQKVVGNIKGGAGYNQAWNTWLNAKKKADPAAGKGAADDKAADKGTDKAGGKGDTKPADDRAAAGKQ